MIWLKDGVVWFPSLKALDQQRSQIKQHALAFRTEDAMPPLRSTLRFEAMVEDWRSGVLEGEIVHVRDGVVGLHLTQPSTELLLRLADEIEKSDKREGTPTRPVKQLPTDSAVPAVSSPIEEAGPTKAVSPTPPASPARRIVTQVMPAATGKKSSETAVVLRGQLTGLFGLGALDYLFSAREETTLAPDCSWIELLKHIATMRHSGRLIVRGATHTKTIWFRGGVPISSMVQPPIDEEQLGQILIKENVLTPHRVGDAIRFAKNNNLSLGATLVQRGLLDETGLARALTRQTYTRLRHIFDWPRATYEFGPSPLPQEPHHPVTIPVFFVDLAEELLRACDWDDVQLLIQPWLHRFPVLSTASEERLRTVVPREKVIKVCYQIFDGK